MDINHKTIKTRKTILRGMAATQPCRRRKATGWQAFPNQKVVLMVLQVL